MDSDQARDREFAFTAQDFERVRKMIYARAGISLSDSKSDLVYGRLARRLRATACRSFSAYLDKLSAEDSSPEWEQFTNALTTNLTAFMREPHHFEMLAEQMLERQRDKPMNIWSSASSTGEEPYSIAITAFETLGDAASKRIRILATDIDTGVLETGRRGIYPIDRIEALDPEVQQHYFLKGKNANEGKVKVAPALQELIRFRQLNLLSDTWPMSQRFSTIFCRNVLIYFDKPTQRKILRHMAQRLEPDGLLFIGHSESLNTEREIFEPMGKTAYRYTGAVVRGEAA